jgi:hypothetical protein
MTIEACPPASHVTARPCWWELPEEHAAPLAEHPSILGLVVPMLQGSSNKAVPLRIHCTVTQETWTPLGQHNLCCPVGIRPASPIHPNNCTSWLQLY